MTITLQAEGQLREYATCVRPARRRGIVPTPTAQPRGPFAANPSGSRLAPTGAAPRRVYVDGASACIDASRSHVPSPLGARRHLRRTVCVPRPSRCFDRRPAAPRDVVHPDAHLWRACVEPPERGTLPAQRPAAVAQDRTWNAARLLHSRELRVVGG